MIGPDKIETERRRLEFGNSATAAMIIRMKHTTEVRSRCAQLIGAKICMARERNGMSQSELAERSRIAQSYVSSIETGHKKLGVQVLLRFAVAIGVEPSELLPTISELDEVL